MTRGEGGAPWPWISGDGDEDNHGDGDQLIMVVTVNIIVVMMMAVLVMVINADPSTSQWISGDGDEYNCSDGEYNRCDDDCEERRPLHPSSPRTPPRSADEATLRLFPGVSNPTNGSHQLAIVIIIISSYLHYHWFGKNAPVFLVEPS